MATLVLTAVGSLIGGPIGGAIGALIGSQVDHALFSPKAAKGARLDRLAVQCSSYGADLPRLFGAMRVAGTVIWSTDLQESRHSSGGGKGKPSTTSYSYAASFAVALSARPIRSVGRIWADGSLLRGAGGDWKGEVGRFRLHTGEEGQAVDPLLAAALGIAGTPAHRGLAYAVFENLQLADYGNRIPSLSFEVEADDGPVPLATVAAILSDGEVLGAGGPLLAGYAASGDSLRGALEGLAVALPVAFAETADGVVLVDETAPALSLAETELGCSADDKRAPLLALDRQAAGTLPEAVSLSYADPARDYQLGAQSARYEASARRAGALDLAAAIDASAAKGLAEAWLARQWAGRTTATLTLPWRRLDLAAGALLRLPGQGGVWRVTDRALEGMLVTLTARRLPGEMPPPPPASPGHGVLEPDLPHGPTTLALLDLPSLGDELPTGPVLLVAAAGRSAGWRRASLMASLDDGASWLPIGRTAPAAVIGQTMTRLPPGSSRMRDQASTVDIEMLNDTMALAGSDATGLSATANLALIGEELVQFAAAEQIGPRLFRLSGLLRGRRGSEAAVGGHLPGERFVLVQPESLLSWSLPAGMVGGTIRIAASGVGDAAPAEASVIFQARALRPPAPVALTATRGADGGWQVGWTRRSRLGWSWLDDIDAPLGEQEERYRLTATRDGASLVREVTAAEAMLSAAEVAALGQGPLRLAVAQIGTAAASLPATEIIVETGA